MNTNTNTSISESILSLQHSFHTRLEPSHRPAHTSMNTEEHVFLTINTIWALARAVFGVGVVVLQPIVEHLASECECRLN